MENNKSKTKLTVWLIILLFVVIATIIVVARTFAKYTTTVEGAGTAVVAKWSFSVQGWGANKAANAVTLTDTSIKSGTLQSGKIAPGTEGSFSIVLDPTGSEVGVDYVVTLSNVQHRPTNLKFYTDSAFNNEIANESEVFTVRGNLPLSKVTSNSPTQTLTIYWRWEYETTAIATNDPIDTQNGIDANTMTFDITVRATQADPRPSPSPAPSLSIGDSVNYTTSLNGVSLTDWSVFYIDGDYTYIILDDYLPNSAVSNTVKTTYNLANGSGSGSYSIKSTTNRTDLINAMETKSNWDELLTGTLNGTTAVNETRTTNVWAMGAPDIELWANSWNSASNGFTTTITTSQNATGYQVNGTYYINIPSEDKNNTNYSLYVPHTSAVDNCYGYWLASPSAGDVTDYVMCVRNDGFVSRNGYTNKYEAFRPVVCLPSSVVNQ